MQSWLKGLRCSSPVAARYKLIGRDQRRAEGLLNRYTTHWLMEVPVVILFASTDKITASSSALEDWVTCRTMSGTAGVPHREKSLRTIATKSNTRKLNQSKALLRFLWNFFHKTITERHNQRVIGQFIMDPVFCFAQR